MAVFREHDILATLRSYEQTGNISATALELGKCCAHGATWGWCRD